jgi:para-nitrobenzyl esterase
VLPKPPLAIIRAGKHNKVPFVAGTTSDEYTQFVSAEAAADVEKYRESVVDSFGTSASLYGNEGGADLILRLYPASAYPTPWDALVSATNDRAMICPTRRVLRALSQAQELPVWQYQFSYVYDDPPIAEFGAGHGFEIDFVFGNFVAVRKFLGREPTEEESELSAAMMGAWAAFAANGDPNTATLSADWPAFTVQKERYIQFDSDIAIKSGLRSDICAEHDSAGLTW